MISLLIVDDDREARDAILHGIDWRSLNITRVRTAQNGLDALAVLEEFMPDIILCDDDMPGMNGFQLGHCIRERQLACKIIYIGRWHDTECMHAALQIGALDYIRKPPDMGKLHRILDKNVADSILEKTAAMQKYAMGLNVISFYKKPIRYSRNYTGGQNCRQEYRQALLGG